MIPQVKLSKSDGNTGVVRPGEEGILAIIAASSLTSTQNQPGEYTQVNALVADAGYGRLPSFAAYVLPVAQNPILALRPATSTAGAYGAIAQTGTGATVATGDGTSLPYDEWDVLITNEGPDGTVGSASPAIAYTTSVDGGVTKSAKKLLGTDTSITIANTGIKVNLTSATWKSGDTIAFKTTPPYATTADLPDTFEALRVTSLPWESVLVDGPASAASIALLDAWLIELEAAGVYRSGVVNLPRKDVGETEAAYLTRMAAIVNAAAPSTRIVVCVDAADGVDFFQGVQAPRPASLFVAARGMAIDLAEDPAYVARGPLVGCSIKDLRGNPKYHDEQIYPGLDALRLATLRSFPGTQGVFVTNANLFSSGTSDYTYWQLLRVMNKACEVAYQILQTQLSKGVSKSSKVGPAGQRYISEQDAARIEGLVNAALTNPLNGRVSEFLFSLSRTDDISSTAGAKITATLQIVPLAYIKEFDVTAGFTKEIVAKLAA